MSSSSSKTVSVFCRYAHSLSDKVGFHQFTGLVFTPDDGWEEGSLSEPVFYVVR